MIPELFTENHFVLEGLLTHCSINYMNRQLFSRIYFISILSFGFILPYSLIIMFYILIIYELNRNIQKTQVKKELRKYVKGNAIRNDIAAAKSSAIIIVAFAISWLPYSILTSYGQFGSNVEEYINPITSTLPVFFAKMSSIYNPFIYTLFNKECRKYFKSIILKKNSNNNRSNTQRTSKYIHSISQV